MNAIVWWPTPEMNSPPKSGYCVCQSPTQANQRDGWIWSTHADERIARLVARLCGAYYAGLFVMPEVEARRRFG